jgi:hypothetical protein
VIKPIHIFIKMFNFILFYIFEMMILIFCIFISNSEALFGAIIFLFFCFQVMYYLLINVAKLRFEVCLAMWDVKFLFIQIFSFYKKYLYLHFWLFLSFSQQNWYYRPTFFDFQPITIIFLDIVIVRVLMFLSFFQMT